ncbi:hypothetical protein P4284_05300 [Bacillus swezeyi]|uniref:hypothetical protein n=1 Tax=Bacillus swezeyi TaxID=1925020 RepID=UPI002E1A19E0|nr:hypothetical protein [Bacillus swezeyi]
MKKLTLSLLIMMLTFAFANPAFANEIDDQKLDEISQKGEIVYMDDEITVRSYGNDKEISDIIFNHPNSVVATDDEEETSENTIKPMASAVGPGGRSSIVAGSSGRIVYWSVKPNTAWPYSFSGLVKLRYHSGFKRNQPVGGIGAFGSTVSGNVTMNKNNGGVAYLSGTAYALNGSKFKVLPGVHESFRAN